MIIKMISAGDIAEITIEEAADAMDLVRAMIANGVTVAKIVKTKTRWEAARDQCCPKENCKCRN